MPTTLGKNLHLCFTKLSRSPTDLNHSTPSPPLPSTKKDSSSITTTSSSSSSSSSSVLIKTFNSLYDITPESSTSKSQSRSSDYFSSSDSDDDSTPPPADFATVYASNRFFFSSPGQTNSIVEESLPESESESDTLINGGVAVPTYSPDPYMDFRRSMQEMVDARDMLLDVTADWDYLHELLLCYLSINPKNAHKFILGAFADLLVSLMVSSKSAGPPPHRKSDISGKCPTRRPPLENRDKSSSTMFTAQLLMVE